MNDLENLLAEKVKDMGFSIKDFPSLARAGKDLPSSYCTEEAEETKEKEESEETEDTNPIDHLSSEEWSALEISLRDCVITKLTARALDRSLFCLAQRIRGWEQNLCGRFKVDLLNQIFQAWHNTSEHDLPKDHDYFADLISKLLLVRFPATNTLSIAFARAKLQPCPYEAKLLAPKVQQLASSCRELQRDAGQEPFYLAGRACAKILGEPHRTVSNWLLALQWLNVISCVSKGHVGNASRYRYVAKDAQHLKINQ